MNNTVQPMSATAPTTTDERRPTATTPTACPVPWCVLGPITAAEHGGGPRAVAHRSPEVVLSGPADEHGHPILARAELFRLDEEGEAPTPTVLYAQGEADAQFSTLSQVDDLIASAEAFVTTLRQLREQMAKEG